MRTLRALIAALVGIWLLFSVGVVLWLRERYGRGGPMPVSQAQLQLHPTRRWLQPVGPTLERFGLNAGDTILELGPGPGYFTVGASQMVESEGRVLCLDIQPEMLSLLHARLEEHHITNAQPMVGDAANLPLADNSVDTAYLVFVLGEIPDRPRAIAELRRVLKPGGLLCTMETLTDPDYIFEDNMKDLLRASGFEVVDHSRQRLGYTMRFRASSAMGASVGV